MEEISFDDSSNSSDDSPIIDDLLFEAPSEENLFSSDESEPIQNELDEFSYESPPIEEDPFQEKLDDKFDNKFEEVKNFAQNFSYGQTQVGGNPPFSLIIRNLKYSEEAQDLLIILRELGIVTDQNTENAAKSLELGSMLIPQISEYSAIILAHKLRRFDCDIEVGLSDEVHPPKSGDSNPRGPTKNLVFAKILQRVTIKMRMIFQSKKL
jgi:hypothetical protein